jgi:citrate lyase subunit beta/citryl-CoA lyase
VRSKLFVPASRPELFTKALASDADAVSFDLEDAVEESRKSAARGALAKLLTDGMPGHGMPGHRKLVVVRVNAIDTAYFAADLEAIVQRAVDVVNLPMVESADTVRAAADALDRLERERALRRPIGLLPNIESPRGVRLAAEIAGAHSRVIGLQLGFGDLFGPLGIVSGEPAATQAIRVAVRMAAGEAGVAAYDGAYVRIDDPEGFRRDAQAAQRLGFTGKSCIHPSQIALANVVFRPSDAEIRHALKVMEAARAATAGGVGAFVVDGHLIDGPFITQAEHTVTLARRLGILPNPG